MAPATASAATSASVRQMGGTAHQQTSDGGGRAVAAVAAAGREAGRGVRGSSSGGGMSQPVVEVSGDRGQGQIKAYDLSVLLS